MHSSQKTRQSQKHDKKIRKNANFSKIVIIFAAIKQSDAHPSIMNKKTYTPFVATHPGEMLKDELKERGISQKQLAEQTSIKPSVISETVNGKRSVSLNVAVALEKALGIPADIWMNMQTQFLQN